MKKPSLLPNAKTEVQTTNSRNTTGRQRPMLRLPGLILCLVSMFDFGGASVGARPAGAPVAPAVIGVAKNASINGTEATFDFYLENLGTTYLNSVVLPEDLDAVFGAGNYTFVSPPALVNDPGTINLNGSFDGSSDKEIFASGSSLPVGGTAQIRMVVNVTTVTDVGFGCGVYSNQVTASAEGGTVSDLSDSGTDPDPNGNGDPAESGENDATVFTVAVPIADLSITKTDGVTTGVPGLSVTYTITASNAGPSNVTGAGFNDILPSAITSATWTSFSSGGASGNTASGSGNINEVLNLPAGASVTYTVSANIAPSATGSLVNTATVTAPVCVTDPIPGNNTATDFDNLLPLADLSILVGDSADPVSIGAGFSYSLDVNNAGPSTATSISVSDNLPAGIGFVSASGTGWSCNESNGVVTCTRASLSVGAAPTITINVTAPGSVGNITNTASVSAGVMDVNLGNNSDSESTAITSPPGFAMAFSPDVIGEGGVSTLTFTIDNTANPVAANSLSFVDNLPAAITIASPLNVSSTCPGATLTAVPGTSLISYSSSALVGGVSCTLQIDVTSSTAGIHVNTTGDLTSSLGNSGTASDMLTVEPPPAFAKAFSPDQILAGNPSTLVFTIDNSASSLSATGLNFSDFLPGGMVVAATPAASSTCTGGAISASAGSGTISYTGGTVAAGTSCTVQVDVTSSTPGMHVNSTGDLTSSLGNSGTASDMLHVNGIIYVDKDATGIGNGLSWTDAFTDLQDALAIAQSGDEIWVAEGVYYPDQGAVYTPGERAHSFVMKNGVAIYGGFPNTGDPTFADRNWATHETILSGDIGTADDNSDNSYHIIFNDNNGLNSSAVLDGFTISGGNANGSGDNTSGGGMYNYKTSPTVKNCIFSGNSAVDKGGGIYNYFPSSPTVTNCTFFDNSAGFRGGGICNYVSGPYVTMTNCTFSNNSAYQGGGIYNDGNSSITVTNCILWGNSSEIGNTNSNPTVTYSIVQGGYTGIGNLDANPLFVDASKGDLRLQASSCAIDNGLNSAVPMGITTDLGSNDRFFNSGTVDIGAYEFQGVYQALTTPTPSATDNGLDFDGVDDHVELFTGCPADNLFPGGDAITVEYWFKGANSQSAVRMQNEGGYIVTAWQNNVHILSNDGGANGISIGTGFDDGNWHHIAFTWQRNTANGFKSYLDGQLVAQRQSSDAPIPSFNSGAYLGAYNGTSEFMNGKLDEVRIWNVARTQAEIQAGLCGELSLPQTGLLAYYQFNHGVADADNTGINTLANSVNTGAYPGILNNFALNGAVSNWTEAFKYTPIRYVKEGGTGSGVSWADASGDLQAMIEACNVEQVWVAAGAYKPTAGADRTISFVMKNGVAIYGGFPDTGNPGLAERDWIANATILSGDLLDDDGPNFTNRSDNSYHVINNNGLDNSALLDGFIISGGNADGAVFTEQTGGGMFNSSSSPTVANCRFTGNSASARGGGMFNFVFSSPKVTDCNFSGNSSGQGGGIANSNTSLVNLINCTFDRNSALGGIGGAIGNTESSPCTAVNCSFTGNTALTGGAVFTRSSAQFTNCTFQGNMASGSGGGIFSENNASPTVTNCIFWQNTGNGKSMFNDAASPQLTHTLLEENTCPSGAVCGAGVIFGQDPLFVSATDLRLQACSPAIDAGDDAANATTEGLDGAPRKVDAYSGGAQIDMGAYEAAVGDDVAPTARCQNVAVQLGAGGSATLTAVQVNNGSSDNCPLLGLSLNRTNFGCADVGMRNV
ncbi:MAG: DUF11 domain-containing protein, partial [Phaeodactylibacter sp.]|nr:DUF11 domain-containing protein [Phaeodactylibacter sp.]